MTDKALTTKRPGKITPGEPLPFEVATTVWLTSMADLSARNLALYRESVAHFVAA